MSYFDMISFEEASLLEGKQAEEYKARKASEKEAKEKAEKERTDRRYPLNDNGYRSVPGNQAKHLKPDPNNNFDRYYGYGLDPKHRDKDKKDIERYRDATIIMDRDKYNKHKAMEDANKDRYYFNNPEKLSPIDSAILSTFKKMHPEEFKQVQNKLDKDYQNKRDNWYRSTGSANDTGYKRYDAVNRHIRRHPKTYKEAVEPFEAYEPEYIDL